MKKIILIISFLILSVILSFVLLKNTETNLLNKKINQEVNIYKDNTDTNQKNNETKNIENNENIEKNNNTVIDNTGYANNSSEIKKTPLQIHGKLSVNGKNIVDKDNNIFVIKGISTHGIAWFGEYVNFDTFKYLRNEYSINTIRIAMYSDVNAGYNKSLHELVKKGVEYAKELGIYCIIDWHILSDNNPNINKQNALDFFEEMATDFKDYDNVLYEICNEPNGNVDFERDIKPYANEVIGKIRSIDSDKIIICGTPNWCQDVDKVSLNPITSYNNIVYSLHFYAATHKEDLINKAKIAINNNLPLLVSEFGICDASGNGNIDTVSADNWFDFLNENNIGYVLWNLSNKNESSAFLKPSVTKLKDWNLDDLSSSGLWYVKKLKNFD